MQKTNEVVNQCFHDSIIAAFIGSKFNFKFNVSLTKPIPRDSLSFNTLMNSISNRREKCYSNLIATNFTMLEVEQFKTVVDILEAKLFLKDLTSDARVSTVHSGQPTLHHNNNSYLYGSWLSSDTGSQEMNLVSLKLNDNVHSRLSTQSSLFDSIYWKWESTSTDKLDDIISDVVGHLEQSITEFWTTNDDTVPEPGLVDNDQFNEHYTCSASFMEAFLSTQNDDKVTLQATNLLTQDKATPTYSPELFSVRHHSRVQSTPLAKINIPGQVLFEDESLNSPGLFTQVDCNKTPVGKMNYTADFTSPPLC